MGTFRLLVKDAVADYAVIEECVVEGESIFDLALAERQRREDQGAIIEGGALYSNSRSFGERITFLCHGPSLGERHQVVFSTFDPVGIPT